MSEQEIKKVVKLYYDGDPSSISLVVEERSENFTIKQALGFVLDDVKENPTHSKEISRMINAKECRVYNDRVGKDILLKNLPFEEREEFGSGRKFLVAKLEFNF